MPVIWRIPVQNPLRSVLKQRPTNLQSFWYRYTSIRTNAQKKNCLTACNKCNISKMTSNCTWTIIVFILTPRPEISFKRSKTCLSVTLFICYTYECPVSLFSLRVLRSRIRDKYSSPHPGPCGARLFYTKTPVENDPRSLWAGQGQVASVKSNVLLSKSIIYRPIRTVSLLGEQRFSFADNACRFADTTDTRTAHVMSGDI